MAARPDRARLSIVLPVFNEVRGLPALLQGLREALEPLDVDQELIFVDDGSTDGSSGWLAALAAVDERVTVIQLARNFGHQAAVQAGLSEARGDAVVVMDSDLQDDPHAIARFLESWRAGADVVYAVRTQRKEAWWKRLLFSGFYRVLRSVAEVPIPLDAGNFGLVDRRVVDELNALPEHSRFFAGLRSWVGYRQTGIPVERLVRYDGRPRVSLASLANLAKTALLSFSTAPVTAFYLIAGACLVTALSLGIYGLVAATGRVGSGSWLFTAMLSAGFGGLNSLGIAVLGEYLLQILKEVRGRPLYCIDKVHRGRRLRRLSSHFQDSRNASNAVVDFDADHGSPEDSVSTSVTAAAGANH
ncbi:MAG: glycosyltransferase family 2 protein [Planctomycetaceae bacterium]|nr:glycosyltransferase family 2 protein [Planctomycetaceae bacterium]